MTQQGHNRGPVFDRSERILIAYYHTIVVYLQEGRSFTAAGHNLTVLESAAKLIGFRTAKMHELADESGEPAPLNTYDGRAKQVLVEVRKGWEKRSPTLFEDNAQWEFFASCTARVFAWRSGMIAQEVIDKALFVMPPGHRNTIEAKLKRQQRGAGT